MVLPFLNDCLGIDSRLESRGVTVLWLFPAVPASVPRGLSPAAAIEDAHFTARPIGAAVSFLVEHLSFHLLINCVSSVAGGPFILLCPQDR